MITDSWIINIIIFVAGLYALVKGSDWFIEGAAYIAHHFKVPDMIIGLTLVSIGTSLPEFATNVFAQLSGDSSGADVAIGNITGSNVANVLLILGLAVILLKTVKIDKTVFHRDVLILMGLYIAFALMVYIPHEGEFKMLWYEGVILAVFFFIYIYILLKKGGVEEEGEDEEHSIKSLGGAYLFILIGGVFTLAGAFFMVETVIWGADSMGIPASIISATVVAFGTSLPELAVTVAGIKKGKKDIAVGNVIGSCTFNIIFVMSATCIISPVPVDSQVLYLIFPFMLLSGLMMTLFMRTKWTMKFYEGLILLILYFSYIVCNVYQAISMDKNLKTELKTEGDVKNEKK